MSTYEPSLNIHLALWQCRRRQHAMYPRLVNFVRLCWILLVAWYELGTFYHHASSCRWPDQAFVSQVRLLKGLLKAENSLKQILALHRKQHLHMFS